MGIITAFANQKGGVGKTSCCLSVGACLRAIGKRVLLVDLDPQGNLTYSSGIEGFVYSVMDLMQKRVKARDAIISDLIASSPYLASADVMFTAVGKEYLLREALADVRDEYDHILLDCPPSLGTLSVNALSCADEVVIPAQADIFSVQGIMQLGETISAVRQYVNPNIHIAGILCNRYNARSVISRDIYDMLGTVAAQLGTLVFKTVIRECTALKEAAALRTDILSHAPRSNAAADFAALTDEFLSAIGGK